MSGDLYHMSQHKVSIDELVITLYDVLGRLYIQRLYIWCQALDNSNIGDSGPITIQLCSKVSL
jgi:hypothetical protein